MLLLGRGIFNMSDYLQELLLSGKLDLLEEYIKTENTINHSELIENYKLHDLHNIHTKYSSQADEARIRRRRYTHYPWLRRDDHHHIRMIEVFLAGMPVNPAYYQILAPYIAWSKTQAGQKDIEDYFERLDRELEEEYYNMSYFSDPDIVEYLCEASAHHSIAKQNKFLFEYLQKLFKEGRNPREIFKEFTEASRDANGATPLQMLAYWGSVSSFPTLFHFFDQHVSRVEWFNAFAEVCDSKGNNGFYYAANSLPVIKCLLDSFQDVADGATWLKVLSHSNIKDVTPLFQIAQRCERSKKLSALLMKVVAGVPLATLLQAFTNKRFERGFSSLELACYGRDSGFVVPFIAGLLAAPSESTKDTLKAITQTKLSYGTLLDVLIALEGSKQIPKKLELLGHIFDLMANILSQAEIFDLICGSQRKYPYSILYRVVGNGNFSVLTLIFKLFVQANFPVEDSYELYNLLADPLLADIEKSVWDRLQDRYEYYSWPAAYREFMFRERFKEVTKVMFFTLEREILMTERGLSELDIPLINILLDMHNYNIANNSNDLKDLLKSINEYVDSGNAIDGLSLHYIVEKIFSILETEEIHYAPSDLLYQFISNLNKISTERAQVVGDFIYRYFAAPKLENETNREFIHRLSLQISLNITKGIAQDEIQVNLYKLYRFMVQIDPNHKGLLPPFMSHEEGFWKRQSKENPRTYARFKQVLVEHESYGRFFDKQSHSSASDELLDSYRAANSP